MEVSGVANAILHFNAAGCFFLFLYTYFKPIVSITSFSTDHCINLANSC